MFDYGVKKLQELREQSTGAERRKYQISIDDHFFKNPDKVQKKKKKVRFKDEEDMWYY